MKTITAEKFLEITGKNPEWAKTLTENVTVVGEVILPEHHPLKALNPKLTFQDYARFQGSQISVAEGVFHQGVNFSNSQIREIGELTVFKGKYGNAASFWECKHLAAAKGTFCGFVDFCYSEIQEISKDFRITAPNGAGHAANFIGCDRLAIARGTFPGFVDFSYSGIREISEDLHVTKPNKKGYAASFRQCNHLAVAKGTFPGWVDFYASGIQNIEEDFHITNPDKYGDAADFSDCQNLTVASGTFCGTVNFAETPITHARKLKITAQKGKPKAIFTKPCLEENPFPLEEIQVPEELKKKLHHKIILKLHKNLKTTLPTLPLGL